jgi:hypothetical protein
MTTSYCEEMKGEEDYRGSYFGKKERKRHIDLR